MKLVGSGYQGTRWALTLEELLSICDAKVGDFTIRKTVATEGKKMGASGLAGS